MGTPTRLVPPPPQDALEQGSLALTQQEEQVFATLLGCSSHFGMKV